MNVFEIARAIFFGDTLLQKQTARAISFSEIDFSVPKLDSKILIDLPRGVNPSRPAAWHSGKSTFPKRSELTSSLKRAEALHFFANHELLAIEGMAYVFLKFPDADPEFLRGLYGILKDEQKHFHLYCERMKELGLEFGQLNLNDYFWTIIQSIQTPYDFVVRMNLTFEQANLDFALEFAADFERLGDTESARILRIIHDDEVKHVAHGIEWFKKWKPAELNEMTAYRKALPHPMTTRRARGNIYDELGRVETGMSSEWIREMKIAGGSRGRRTKHWLPNIFAEMEASQGRTLKFSELNKSFQEKILDLEPIWLWLGEEADCIYHYGELSPIEFREHVSLFKNLPDIKSVSDYPDIDHIPSGNELQTWYAGPSLNKLFKKTFWASQLPRKFDVSEFSDESLCIGKPDFGTSGRGQKIGTREEIDANDFIGVIEPFRKIIQEYSVQCEMDRDGKVNIIGALQFKVGKSRQFLGTIFGTEPLWKKMSSDKIKQWKTCIDAVATVLKNEKYCGAFGIDAYTFIINGIEKFEPFSELNPRWTFGRVALELEKIFRQRTGKNAESAAWLWFTKGDCIRHKVSNFIELKKKLISQGLKVISTTPESTARGTWTAWVEGPELEKWIKQD